MSASPATLAWFAGHELRLGWREGMALMTGGKRARAIGLILGTLLFAVLFHLLAHAMIAPWAAQGISADKGTLALLLGGGFLFWTVMLSQAMESVTRAYYARADLDLILSSPASVPALFAVRAGSIALVTVLLACLLAAPLIDALIFSDGLHWLAAYGVLVALGALSAALALGLTRVLFRLVGPRRTRVIAQIVAAVVGAGFVIGIQAAAILSFGSLSQFTILQSEGFVAAMPDTNSLLWLPVRAAMGDLPALGVVLLVGFGTLALAIGFSAPGFGRQAIAASSAAQAPNRKHTGTIHFAETSQARVLRQKEWLLLRRDPWLLSQTLMQMLYLLPPALMLWISYGQSAGAFIVVIPVLVMAAGQLAGGLAWLAVSGEDAHDLVSTAPIRPSAVIRAKIEAVLAVIGIVFAPILALMVLASWQLAAITAACAALAAGSATAIQLWFRVPMRRVMFRRRQVASRAATLCEAFASIMLAGTGALWAGDSWLALVPAATAIGVLCLARALSPKRS